MSKLQPAKRLKLGIYRLGKSFLYAFSGIRRSVYTERNLRIHLCALVLVTEFGFLYHLTPMEWVIICLLFGLMLVSELWNTAIEALADLATRYENELVRVAKDVAAGAVLLMAVMSVVVGVIIFRDTERLQTAFSSFAGKPLWWVLLAAELPAAVWFVFLFGDFREEALPYREKKEKHHGK